MTVTNIKSHCPDCGRKCPKNNRIVVRTGEQMWEYYCPNCRRSLKEQFKNPVKTVKKAIDQVTKENVNKEYGYLGSKHKFRY